MGTKENQTEVDTEAAEARLLTSATPRMHVQVTEGVVNPIELAKALGVRPQQVYNDIRAGRLGSVTHTVTQKMVIEWDDAVEYSRKRFDRELQKELKVQAELAGETVDA